MRGKARRVVWSQPLYGITPAYAGKRWRHISSTRAFRDHPRVCGEKHQSRTEPITAPGSPPRMRGKDPEPHWRAVPAGITPAYAGKRPVFGAAGTPLRDHPRVCGEKTKIKKPFTINAGSPPRMRGKVINLFEFFLSGRITPAYAGKRHTGGMWVPGNTDHPRVCGEKGLTFHQMLRPTGSPPRMRGKD